MSCPSPPPDVARACEEWGATCGPGALAAALGLTLAEVRPAVSKSGHFPGYMSIPDIERALRRLERRPPHEQRHANG